MIAHQRNSVFNGPQVWRGADFASTDPWSFPLTSNALAELETIVSGSLVGTPALDRNARAIRKELASGRGFVVIRHLPLDRWTEDQARVAYTEICRRIGPLLPQTLAGDTLYSVRDEGLTLERDYGRAGVRTSKTRSAFQFHTDSPSRLAGHTPDYVGLLVLRTAKSGGETALVNGYEAHNILAAERPDVLDRLYQPYLVDRRAETPPGEPEVLPVPVFFADTGRLFVRYLRFYITKGHEWRGVPLAAADVEALDALDEVMNRAGVALTITPQRGDAGRVRRARGGA